MKKIKYFSYLIIFITFISIPLLSSCKKDTFYPLYQYAKSSDGELVAYLSYGKGEVTLVFIHGWSCDSTYWKQQIPYFSKKYKTIALDLAGHGKSGSKRKVYSLESFAQDVKAVVDYEGSKKVILIGHSMGGGVMAKAALLMPKRVIGLIGVDTLQNVESALKKEEVDGIIEAYKNDFKGTVVSFLESMFTEDSNKDLKNWIMEDMSSANPDVGISAFKEYIETYYDGGMAKIFDKIKVPIICINASLRPTDVSINKRHSVYYDVKVMEGLGHFIMLEKPKKFNKILTQTIKEIIQLNNKTD